MINWKTCQNRPHIKQRKVAYLNLKETVQRKRNRLSKQKKAYLYWIWKGQTCKECIKTTITLKKCVKVDDSLF